MRIDIFGETVFVDQEDSWVCSNEYDNYFKDEEDDKFVILEKDSFVFAIKRRSKKSLIDEDSSIRVLDLLTLEVENHKSKGNEKFISKFFTSKTNFLI